MIERCSKNDWVMKAEAQLTDIAHNLCEPDRHYDGSSISVIRRRLTEFRIDLRSGRMLLTKWPVSRSSSCQCE